MHSLNTLCFAWISWTLTTGSRVRSWLFCWFILLFIQTMASVTCLSTRFTSSSSRWSYCSSCWEKRRKNELFCFEFKKNLIQQKQTDSYLCLESFDGLHVKLDLSAKLLKCFWPLFIFHASVKNWLANFLLNVTIVGLASPSSSEATMNISLLLKHRLQHTTAFLTCTVTAHSSWKR